MVNQYQLRVPKSRISNPDELEQRLENVSKTAFEVKETVDEGDTMCTTLVLDYPLPARVERGFLSMCAKVFNGELITN